jgi:hypothetical protein
MGSVITHDEKCPECGKEKGISDFYYKTMEEYFCCNECGFSYSYVLKRDDDGKLVTKDGSDTPTYQNVIMVETIIKKGEKTVKELNKED